MTEYTGKSCTIHSFTSHPRKHSNYMYKTFTQINLPDRKEDSRHSHHTSHTIHISSKVKSSHDYSEEQEL